VDTNLQAKADTSDVVQETFVQAVRDFHAFRGETEAEFVAWLRRILANTGVAMIRKFKQAQLRDVNRERRFDDRLAQSSAALDKLLVARDESPSRIAAQREGAVVLADALAKLPDDYREVLVLHHLEGLAVSDVARRMGRTVSAVKGIRTRAVLKLRSLLKERPQ